MKKEILKLIHCPRCQGNLDLQNDFADHFEITTGNLFCQNCQSSFVINKGIVFLDHDLTVEVEKEREALKTEIAEQQNELAYQNEAWLLSFPNNEQKVIDDRSDKIMNLVSENTLKSLEKFIPSNNLSILEIGSGNCWVINRLAKNNYCIALDMFDLPPKGLESGKVFIKHQTSYFERVIADMIKLPFKDGSFDIVLISSALHHSSDLSSTLKEINRVLKSDGKLILLNEPSTGLIPGAERKQIETDLENGVNENRYTIKEWKKAIKKDGFTIKIHLPENIFGILLYKNGFFKLIGIFLSRIPKSFLNIILYLITTIVLKTFDGFFNAVAIKNSKAK